MSGKALAARSASLKEERFFTPLINSIFVKAISNAIMAMKCWTYVGEKAPCQELIISPTAQNNMAG